MADLPSGRFRRLRHKNCWLTAVAVLACFPASVTGQELSDGSRRVLESTSDAVYGDWGYIKNQDVMDDTDRSFVITVAIDGERNETAFFRCFHDGLNFVYSWDKYLAGDSDGEVLVRFRVDRNPASDGEYWSLYPNHNRGFMPMGMVTEFRRQAELGTRLFLRVTDPSDGEILSNTYSLRGVTEALNRLACAH